MQTTFLIRLPSVNRIEWNECVNKKKVKRIWSKSRVCVSSIKAIYSKHSCCCNFLIALIDVFNDIITNDNLFTSSFDLMRHKNWLIIALKIQIALNRVIYVLLLLFLFNCPPNCFDYNVFKQSHYASFR